MTLCVGLAGALCVTAQDEVKEPPKNTVPEDVSAVPKKQGDLISSEEILNSIEKSGLDFDSALFSDDALSRLTVDTNNVVERVYTNDLTVLELKRIQITGTTTPLVKKRTFGTFLQLFNPLAPTEYGGTGEPVGKAPSRAFLDPIETTPTTPLIGVGNRPSKPEK